MAQRSSSHADQPDDHHFIRGGLRGVGHWRVGWELRLGNSIGVRRVYRLCSLVAPLELGGKSPACAVDAPLLVWVNRASGAIIAGFGVVALLSLVA